MVFLQPCLCQLAVMHTQIVLNQEHLAPRILDQGLKNSISFSWLSAPSMIIQRALLWLVTLAISDSFWRGSPIAIVTGAWPLGA